MDGRVIIRLITDKQNVKCGLVSSGAVHDTGSC